MACHRVDIDRGFVRIVVGPSQGRRAGPDEYPQVPLSLTAQTDPEVGVRIRIMLASGDQQDLSQFADRQIEAIDQGGGRLLTEPQYQSKISSWAHAVCGLPYLASMYCNPQVT